MGGAGRVSSAVGVRRAGSAPPVPTVKINVKFKKISRALKTLGEERSGPALIFKYERQARRAQISEFWAEFQKI